jgi:hypothetical protein
MQLVCPDQALKYSTRRSYRIKMKPNVIHLKKIRFFDSFESSDLIKNLIRKRLLQITHIFNQ